MLPLCGEIKIIITPRRDRAASRLGQRSCRGRACKRPQTSARLRKNVFSDRRGTIPFRQRLRPSTSDHLLVPTVKLSAVGRRAFPVADARTWNDLPSDVTSSSSLFTFKHPCEIRANALISPFLYRSNLITVLTASYPDLVVIIAAACCL